MRSLVVITALLAACSKPDGPGEVPPGLVRVSDDTIVVRTATVGEGRDRFDEKQVGDRIEVTWKRKTGPVHQQTATFVLVDAQNISDHDLLITLGGELIDADGKSVGHLRPESLRMPAGASRTFALVDEQNAARPEAVTARVVPRGAVAPTWAPTMTLSEGNAFDVQGLVQVAARVTNEADRPGKVIVLAGFHDDAGKPVVRQFDVVELEAEESRVVRFTGPEGATRGAIWLGESTY